MHQLDKCLSWGSQFHCTKSRQGVGIVAQIVVLGSDGWLGSNIHRFYGHDSIGFTGAEVRKLLLTSNLRNTFLNIHEMSNNITIINAIGSRYGDKGQMLDANTETPHKISEIVSSLDLHFVHFGSAAEYQINSEKLRINESMSTSPSSEYGKSKLAGSIKVLEHPRSLVLRLFNVVGLNLPSQNPLIDIRLKVAAAQMNSEALQLRNSSTVRDFISIDLFLRTLKFSIDNKLNGVFNVCSGEPVSFGEIAREIATRADCTKPIESKIDDPTDFIVGDPSKLRSISGINEYVDASTVVDWLSLRC